MPKKNFSRIDLSLSHLCKGIMRFFFFLRESLHRTILSIQVATYNLSCTWSLLKRHLSSRPPKNFYLRHILLSLTSFKKNLHRLEKFKKNNSIMAIEKIKKKNFFFFSRRIRSLGPCFQNLLNLKNCSVIFSSVAPTESLRVAASFDRTISFTLRNFYSQTVFLFFFVFSF